MDFQTGLAIGPKLFFGTCLLLLLSAPAQASSIHVSADSFEYEPEIGDFNLDFTAMGAAIGGNLDVNDGLSFQFEWGEWKDDASMNMLSTADFKSTLISLGMEYSLGNWTLNAIYSDVSDKIDVMHGNMLEFHTSSDADLMSLRFSAAYEQKTGNWAYYGEGGLQYDEADTDAVFDQENLAVMQIDKASFAMAKIGGDYYIPAGQKSAWFIGGNLSWYQELSSDTDTTETNIGGGMGAGGMGGPKPPRRPPPGVGGGNNGPGTNINRTFGDSFGILGVYTTYQINESWSIDWTSSFGFAGEKNADSHALTLSYTF